MPKGLDTGSPLKTAGKKRGNRSGLHRVENSFQFRCMALITGTDGK
jgi:hypothetical protein